MAISEYKSGTASVSTTEYSLVNNSTTIATDATDGVYQAFIDVSNMVAGDQLNINIYEKCRSADTQRLIYSSDLIGAQPQPIWVSPSLVLMHGWDITVTTVVGGTITVNWSIRQVA